MNSFQMNIAKRISKKIEIILFPEYELFANSQNLAALYCCTCPVSVSCWAMFKTYIEVLSFFLIWSKPGRKPPSLSVNGNRSFSKTLAPAPALKLLINHIYYVFISQRRLQSLMGSYCSATSPLN